MATDNQFRDYVLDILGPAANVTVRRMFGGLGFFVDGVMFAIGSADDIYFKVDDSLVAAFEAHGMGPFLFQSKRGEAALRTYYQLPAEILEDPEEIVVWAERSIDAAMRADAVKPPGQRKRKGAGRWTVKELADLP